MDWQARYETGDTPWDEGAPHPALTDYITQAGPFTGRILVPGCGLGHDVRALSTSANLVLGLDIAPVAIHRARLIPSTGHEDYLLADFFNLDPQLHSSFDWIIEHTCFCAIHPTLRPAYAVAAACALKPRAHCFAIFYLNPASHSHPPYGVTIPELDHLFSPFFTTLNQWTPIKTFPGRESRELVRLLQLKTTP